MSVFSPKEMRRRMAAVRSEMARAGVDALILTSYASIYYYSGAPIHQFGRPALMLLPLDGEPVLIANMLEQRHIQLQSWLTELRFYSDHNVDESYRDPKTPEESVQIWLGRELRSRNLAAAVIGVEDETMPLRVHSRIQDNHPDARLVPASQWLDRIRMVLSNEELDLVRAADEISDIGQMKLLEILKPGSRGDELSQACHHAMESALVERHPDKPFVTHQTVGLADPHKFAGSSEWHTFSKNDVAKPGMVLDTIFSCFLWGYFGNVERAISVGKPSKAVHREIEIMVEANEEAISAVRPGVPIRQIDQITKDVFTRHGYPDNRFGTGLFRGIASHEAGARLLQLDLRLYNDEILQPGMAFSIEPMLGSFMEGSYRHCNTIIVTETGSEVVNKVPRGVLYVE